MLNQFKIFPFVLFLFIGAANVHAQKACCAGGDQVKTDCDSHGSVDQQNNAKVCCTKTAQESTSGCTPSNCRGAKTKFGEAKVISELRMNLIALKAKIENHKDYEFSDQAISVHDIIGETDDESLEIVSEHVAVIESELYAFMERRVPSAEPTERKAVLVKQLKKKIIFLTESL